MRVIDKRITQHCTSRRKVICIYGHQDTVRDMLHEILGNDAYMGIRTMCCLVCKVIGSNDASNGDAQSY